MSPKSEIRLFVIVPVFGNWDETMDCLRALEAQTTRQFDVLIADDGSPELPPPDIHGLSLTTYLRHPHRGFAANCNAAAREAIRRGATHLLFLNNDTAFSLRFLEAWLSTVAVLPEAILSPNIYWYDDPA